MAKGRHLCKQTSPDRNATALKVKRDHMRKVISQHLIGMFLLLSFVLLAPPSAGATEEYARQTGQACAVCHLDPGGGGELTAAGTAFAD